jgi:hypothetical protein
LRIALRHLTHFFLLRELFGELVKSLPLSPYKLFSSSSRVFRTYIAGELANWNFHCTTPLGGDTSEWNFLLCDPLSRWIVPQAMPFSRNCRAWF